MEQFLLNNYLSGFGADPEKGDEKGGLVFSHLCTQIQDDFIREWEENRQDIVAALNLQKRALMGHDREVGYFKRRIGDSIRKYAAGSVEHPSCYDNLVDAIYHENWGVAGVAEWFSERNKSSSSAKIIGDRIYFLENGRMCLKKQRVDRMRREQMIRAFLLMTPEERIDKEIHEIYLLDGTRVTIYGGSMVKKDQDVIIFRRYTVPDYSFEEQAARGTIPAAAIPLFKSMVSIGFNVAFTGAVRTAKTTFLSTWQRCEDPALEGVMVETDPEIPLHAMMKDAPIIQILADNEKLKNVSKYLLRSDADYFIMAEARDGIALDTVLKLASKGTRRMKITFHSSDPLEFCLDVAAEITKSYGGDHAHMAVKAAKSFDYVFHFIQLPHKGQKRLGSIHELSYDRERGRIVYQQICKYRRDLDDWQWYAHISPGKQLFGEEEGPAAYMDFEACLKQLAVSTASEKGGWS